MLFEIRRSLATIVRLPWRRAIAVRMASRSTASRSRTAADSAETPGSRPVAATERAISSGSAAAVTVSSRPRVAFRARFPAMALMRRNSAIHQHSSSRSDLMSASSIVASA